VVCCEAEGVEDLVSAQFVGFEVFLYLDLEFGKVVKGFVLYGPDDHGGLPEGLCIVDAEDVGEGVLYAGLEIGEEGIGPVGAFGDEDGGVVDGVVDDDAADGEHFDILASVCSFDGLCHGEGVLTGL